MHEIFSQYGEVVATFPGYNRLVARVRSEGQEGDRVVKVIRDDRRAASTEEIALLRERLTAYARALRALGVRVDEPEITILHHPSRATPHLVEVGPYRGETIDYHFSLAHHDNEVRFLTRAVLSCIEGLFTQKGDPRFPVGIDPVLRNFALDNGEAYYIDLYAPKIAHPNGRFGLEWPAEPEDTRIYELGVWRNYHPTGLLQVLLIQLCRSNPKHLPVFADEIARFGKLAGVGEPVVPVLTPQTLDEARPEQGGYDVRFLACRLASEGAISHDTVCKVFELTHFQETPIPPDRFEQAVALLKE